jgi:hypothetical protein
MAKTVTIKIPNKLGQAMDEFKNVSWSQVCTTAIEEYIKARRKIGVGSFSYDHELFEDMGGYRG